ncbi:CPBP family intramembrane glutamic endopeptidase [Caulobacter sp. 17J65-9]|uniref:CPBP family glutamic-type intramembrane protease n=1 Tax=Caulobacter sp. 17J65-9 TaxID=2709382 RepID=UPI0013C641AA|nr:CPBP family intramembrane metalloprotease [Caulobacter sp. 17J65-9]
MAWFFLGCALSFAGTAALGVILGVVSPQFLAIFSDMEPVPEGVNRLWLEVPFMGVLALVLTMTAGSFVLAASACFQRPMASFLAVRRPNLTLALAGFVTLGALVMGSVWVESVLTGERLSPPVLDVGWPFASRVAYAAAAAPLLLIAAAAEEAFCRGVLLQISGAFSRRILALSAINGLIFAAVHVDPDPAAFIARGLSGFLFAWATLRLGGLEFAVGAHWANNLALAWFFQPFSEAAQPGQGYPPVFLIADVTTTLIAVAVIEFLARRVSASAAAGPTPAAPPADHEAPT